MHIKLLKEKTLKKSPSKNAHTMKTFNECLVLDQNSKKRVEIIKYVNVLYWIEVTW